MKAMVAGVALLAGLAGAASWVLAARQEPFPHEEHARLFSFCTGCHEMDTGDRTAMYPPVELCSRCHDGTLEDSVVWQPPTAAIGRLIFDHPVHARVAVDDALACETCHVPSGAARMAVLRADGPGCLGCHAHQASEHHVDADCATCHVRLAETRFTTAQIAAQPTPSDHDAVTFLGEGHGRSAATSSASCEVCHTRERCVACHVNAATVPVITAMMAAPRELVLPPMEARYEEPASHRTADFQRTHGTGLEPGSCGACHARDDCAACHVPPVPAAVAALPQRIQVAAPGAMLQRAQPFSHEAPGYRSDHAADAATHGASCTACHTRTSCSECHAAAQRAAFHPDNFFVRHSAEAYGRRLECSGCHETQTFCRDCHTQAGMQAEGRLNPGFHDAEPLWLLRHGGPARRALESCTACHRQTDCLQCHSTLGSFRVSPHREGFDARAAQSRNPIICKACHIGDPIRRN